MELFTCKKPHAMPWQDLYLNYLIKAQSLINSQTDINQEWFPKVSGDSLVQLIAIVRLVSYGK